MKGVIIFDEKIYSFELLVDYDCCWEPQKHYRTLESALKALKKKADAYGQEIREDTRPHYGEREWYIRLYRVVEYDVLD